MDPTRNARPLADALAESPVGPVLQRLSLFQRIASTISPAVAQLAPDFDSIDPSAVNLRENVLWLNARSAAQAAKLRQGVPGLLQLLHQHGFQVIEVRVKVQPARMTYPEQTNEHVTQEPPVAADKPSRTHVDAGARAFAEQLARDLPDCPLRDAALRLQAALRRKP
jgi:hypothetical protein